MAISKFVLDGFGKKSVRGGGLFSIKWALYEVYTSILSRRTLYAPRA